MKRIALTILLLTASMSVMWLLSVGDRDQGVGESETMLRRHTTSGKDHADRKSNKAAVLDEPTPSGRDSVAGDECQDEKMRVIAVDGTTKQPIAGVVVSADVEMQSSGETDEYGIVEIVVEDLRLGVRFEARGFLSTTLDWAATQLLEEDKSAKAWRVELRRSGLLEIVVRDATTKEPLKNVEVWLGVESSRRRGEGSVGDLCIEHLRVEGWQRSAFAQHPIPYAAFLGMSDSTGAILAEGVPQNEEMYLVARAEAVLERRAIYLSHSPSTITIEARVGRTVSGRLVWENGQPLERGWLRLHDGWEAEERTLGSGGNFVVPRVKGPVVRLELIRPIPYETTIDLGVAGADMGDIIVPLAGTFGGQILMDNPVHEWFVEIWQEGVRVVSQSSGLDGRFELTAFDGPAILCFSSAWSSRDSAILEVPVPGPASDLIVDAIGAASTVRIHLSGVSEGDSVKVHEFIGRSGEEQNYEDRTLWGSRALNVGTDGIVLRADIAAGPRAWLVDAGLRGHAWTGIIEVPSRGCVDIGPLNLGFGQVVRREPDAEQDIMLVSPVYPRVRVPSGDPTAALSVMLPPGPWMALPFVAGAVYRPGSWFEVHAGQSADLIVPKPEIGSIGGIIGKEFLVGGAVHVEFRRHGQAGGLAELRSVPAGPEGRFELARVEAGPGFLHVRRGTERIATMAVAVPPGDTIFVEVGSGERGLHARFRLASEFGASREFVSVSVGALSTLTAWPARSCEDGMWSASCGYGPALVGVEVGPGNRFGHETEAGVLMGRVDLGADLALAHCFAGALEVELPDAVVHAPTAYVETVHGVDPSLLYSGSVQSLVRARIGSHKVVFHAIPEDCTIVLAGEGLDGRPLTRKVRIRDGWPRTLSWPGTE